MKVCQSCKKELPPDSFHSTPEGRLRSRCKKCRAEYENKRRKKKRDERLDALEQDGVDAFVKIARSGGSNIPHSAEMIEVLLEYFGGVRGFGNVFMKQFWDSPPGGSHRTRMLETVVRLVSNNTALGGARKPLDLMSEEELESELRRQVLEAAMDLKRLEVVEPVRIEE